MKKLLMLIILIILNFSSCKYVVGLLLSDNNKEPKSFNYIRYVEEDCFKDEKEYLGCDYDAITSGYETQETIYYECNKHHKQDGFDVIKRCINQRWYNQ